MINNLKLDLVSIVFTSYNHKTFLKKAIDSLISQTYSNIQIIIVDDCSSDGSQEILKDYKSFENIKLILLDKNTGSYVKASNYGAKFATGKYILFAQCDDFSDPKQIEMLVGGFVNDKIGVVFSRSNLINENDIVIGNDFNIRERKFRAICTNSSFLNKNLMLNFLSYSCVIPNLSAAMIKRDFYLKVGGLSEKYLVASDWNFWLELASFCDFYYLSAPLNNFRQHATTIRSSTKLITQIVEVYDIFYNYSKIKKLNWKQSLDIKIGAGSIACSFIFQSKKNFISLTYNTFINTYKYDKLNFIYLILGFFRNAKQKVFLLF
jgi:glycosyltransferase involved in cell wall biosynthesis